MNSYLLTWNPKRWKWDMAENLATLKTQSFFDLRWSCGQTKRIELEDRVFVLRQGLEPRGILASGKVKSRPFYENHWDERRNDQALFVNVRFDALLDPDDDGVLPLSQLKTGPLASINWSTQASGISITPLAASELEKLWRSFLESCGQLPPVTSEEISTPSLYFEGASRTITVNAYERDPRARKACIEYYGYACVVCGFDFEAFYGDLGKGFIHVHHITPLSEIGNGYVINPVRDLRPVCPNCHSMLHKQAEVLPIDDLKCMVKK